MTAHLLSLVIVFCRSSARCSCCSSRTATSRAPADGASAGPRRVAGGLRAARCCSGRVRRRAPPTSSSSNRRSWIPAFGIDYHVGVDGISLLLVVLTGFLTPISLLSSWESIEKKTKEFTFFVLALEAAMLGVFVSLDLFLFYVFWDAMLIPMYFLIGIWGYDRRIYAAIKFMLYTMAGSVLMLVAILGLGVPPQRGDRQLLVRLPQAARRCRSRRRRGTGSSSPSRWRSPSRCRCSRSTRGCRTHTSRRRQRAR